MKDLIQRLLHYKNDLYRFKALGLKRIYSGNLADSMGIKSTQVRKDFSMLKLTGNKKAGYKTDDLIEQINALLGKSKPQDVILVGVGNIGSALRNYKGFEKEAIRIKASFDINPERFANDDGYAPVYPIEGLRGYVRQHRIRTAIMAVPESSAMKVYETLVDSGVRGILNFTPLRFKAPGGVIVKDVNLVMELESVIYFVNTMNGRGGEEGRQPC